MATTTETHPAGGSGTPGQPAAPPPAPAKPKLRLTFIDGLRGVAALWVMVYHVWNRFYPGLSTQGGVFTPAGHHPSNVLFYLTFGTMQYGYIGVDIFFVLSGFCIHYAQAKDRGLAAFRVGDFARRRFFRLYPAYLASIAFSLFALGFFPLVDVALNGKHINLAGAFDIHDAFLNAAFLQLFWPRSLAFNGVYWTLVYEIQFYAFYPLLLVASRKLPLKAIIAGLLATEVFCAYHSLPIPNLFFYRYYEWCLGMLAAEIAVRSSDWRLNAGVVAGTGATLAAGLASVFWRPIYPLRDALLSTGFFGVLLCGVRGSAGDRSAVARAVARILETPWLVNVGLYSYSLYLVHVPVIDLFWKAYAIAVKMHPALAPAVYALPLLCIPAALWLASTLYKYVEKPFMRLGRPVRAAEA